MIYNSKKKTEFQLTTRITTNLVQIIYISLLVARKISQHLSTELSHLSIARKSISSGWRFDIDTYIHINVYISIYIYISKYNKSYCP